MTPVRSFLVLVMFFSSGLTSLVYQVLWVRSLSLGVGATATSMSLVLSIFFFGLATGSYFAGRWSHRIKNPILAYGALEGAIGLYSLGLIYVLMNLHTVMGWIPFEGSFGWVGAPAKFLLVFALLFFPTLSMGASLPILVKIFVRSQQGMGQQIGRLYGINTLGAVTGAFLAGFVLIPQLGVTASNHVTALVNGLIFLASIYLGKGLSFEAEGSLSAKATTPTRQLALGKFQKVLLVASFVTGFSSIASEVVWNKYLGIFMGSNIFGLSLVLSLFLLGLAVGSLMLSVYVDRVRSQYQLFMGLLFFSIIAIFAASRLLNVAPIAANVISYYLQDNLSLLTIKSVLVALILFLPTTIFGALLPLTIRMLTDQPGQAAQVTGLAYSINTLGAILGSCLSGLVLIPTIGSSGTTLIALTGLCLVGVMTAVSGPTVTLTQPRRRAVAALSFLALLLSMSQVKAVDFKNIIKSAYFARLEPGLGFSEVVRYFSEDYEDYKLIFEGKTAIISLSHDSNEGVVDQGALRLKTNGLNESFYDFRDLKVLPKYEALLGFLPFSFMQAPSSAFIVGYGGGYTVDFLTSTKMKQVHVAELEEGILKAADYVYKGDNPLLKRDNLKLNIEDARFVLAAELGGPYDIIVSQPSHSWLSGVANLFTEDFFQIVKKNLKSGGIYSQWLNLYNMDSEVLKSILKTFYSTFPHGAVFTDVDDEQVILLGAMQPLEMDLERLAEYTRQPDFAHRLQFIPFASPYDLLRQFSLSRADALRIAEGATINTDDNAFAEVLQSTLFYQGRATRPAQFINDSYSADFSEILPEALRAEAGFYGDILDRMSSDIKNFNKFHVLTKRYAELASTPAEKAKLAKFYIMSERYASAIEVLKNVVQKSVTRFAVENLVLAYLESQQYSMATDVYEKYRTTVGTLGLCYVAEAYLQQDRLSQARPIVRKLQLNKVTTDRACGLYYLKVIGLFDYQRGEHQSAMDNLYAYLKETPSDVDSVQAILGSALRLRNVQTSLSYADYLSEAIESEKQRRESVRSFYRHVGLESDAALIPELP